jgi:hypothetical protein
MDAPSKILIIYCAGYFAGAAARLRKPAQIVAFV